MSVITRQVNQYRQIKSAFEQWSTHANKVQTLATQWSLVRVWAWVSVCRERVKQRRHLAQLDAYLLKDIGMSEWQRQHEITKRWWQT